jgi:hypothetical protein
MTTLTDYLFSMTPILNNQLEAAIHHHLTASDDLYANLNQLRDWANATFTGIELYMEDVWNENVDGETHFEYILRSRQTFEETPPLGADVYLNSQDSGNVWHLGDYQSSHLNYPLREVITMASQFIQAHSPTEARPLANQPVAPQA